MNGVMKFYVWLTIAWHIVFGIAWWLQWISGFEFWFSLVTFTSIGLFTWYVSRDEHKRRKF